MLVSAKSFVKPNRFDGGTGRVANQDVLRERIGKGSNPQPHPRECTTQAVRVVTDALDAILQHLIQQRVLEFREREWFRGCCHGE